MKRNGKKVESAIIGRRRKMQDGLTCDRAGKRPVARFISSHPRYGWGASCYRPSLCQSAYRSGKCRRRTRIDRRFGIELFPIFGGVWRRFISTRARTLTRAVSNLADLLNEPMDSRTCLSDAWPCSISRSRNKLAGGGGEVA